MSLSKLPAILVDAVREPAGAHAYLLGILLPRDSALDEGEIARLKEVANAEALNELGRIYSEIGSLNSSQRLALLDRALPTLRRLTPAEYEEFSGTIQWLIERDESIDLFEFTLQKILKRNLDSFFNRVTPVPGEYRKLSELREEFSMLLSTLAYLGHREDRAAAETSFGKGVSDVESHLGGAEVSMKEDHECTLANVDAALDRFSAASSGVKRQLMQACGKCVMADEEIRDEEADLIRALSDAIGASIPLRSGEAMSERAASGPRPESMEG